MQMYSLVPGAKAKGRPRVGTQNFHRVGLIPTASFRRYMHETGQWTDETIEKLMSAIEGVSQVLATVGRGTATRSWCPTVIPGVSLQEEGKWSSINGRGLGKILGVLKPEAKGKPTSLGKLLMPHSLFEGEKPTSLVADYIRVSAKEEAGPETHEFHRLKSANRTGKNISQCEWEEVQYKDWHDAGGWDVQGKGEDDDDEEEEV
jgi:hypothetical protein